MKLQTELSCSGILKLNLLDNVHYPVHSNLILNKKMHITLVHQSNMKALSFNGMRLDKWLSKNKPEIQLEIELNDKEPVLLTENHKTSQVYFVTQQTQENLDAFLKLYFDSLGLTNEFKEIKKNGIDAKRRYHLSYANKTGNPGDSVAVVW